MKVAIGCDHRGVELKNKIKEYLNRQNIEVKDFGTNSKKSCDYPDFGFPVAKSVSNGEFDFGILICMSGIGMSITANKVKGVRAALCLNSEQAVLARKHNDANVLVLSANFTPNDEVEKILNAWFSTKFEGDRHIRRLEKIRAWEENFIEKSIYERDVKKWQKEARKWQSMAWRK